MGDILVIMEITKEEKAAIRKYYEGQYKIRFLPDGTVEAKKTGSSSWGILYTPWYTEQHLEWLRNEKKVI